MGSSFGFFAKSQKGVKVKNLSASFVDGKENINHPSNPESPNYPRSVGRFSGYQDPVLGDSGRGKIGRWQFINIDALEAVINQMIEHYVKDKNWYAGVRCREALWNMYRRIAWFVKNQADPNQTDYQRTLIFIKDCINHVLEHADGTNGMPTCPAPYVHNFQVDYLNHFDKTTKNEGVLFDLNDFNLSEFPAYFNFSSAMENIEWDFVKGVGSFETSGNEKVLMFDISKLPFSNSTKLSVEQRFRSKGYITFKMLCSVSKGNGMLFFINSNHIGGEWYQQTDWVEYKIPVTGSQVFKFDWFIRSQTEKPFGYNKVYLKEIKFVEETKDFDAQTPPDYDEYGSSVFNNINFDWYTYSSKSIAKTDFRGTVESVKKERTLVYELENECDGVIEFKYKMGSNPPIDLSETNLIYSDQFNQDIDTYTSPRKTVVIEDGKTGWIQTLRDHAETTTSNAVRYNIEVGSFCTVRIEGNVSVVCPPIEIDYYEPRKDVDFNSVGWVYSGFTKGVVNGKTSFYVNDIKKGSYELSKSISNEFSGHYTFYVTYEFKESETLYVYLNGVEVRRLTGNATNKEINVFVEKGTNLFEIKVIDLETELKKTYEDLFNFQYGQNSKGTTYRVDNYLGSYADITRMFEVDSSSTYATVNNVKNTYKFLLKPNTSAKLTEDVQFIAGNLTNVTYTVNEEFALNRVPSNLNPQGNWAWVNRTLGGQLDPSIQVVRLTEYSSINTLTTENAHTNFLRFRYACKFYSGESLKIYDNGSLIWQTNKDSSLKEEFIELVEGNHQIEFVYEQVQTGSKTETITRLIPGTATPNGEVCFISGSETWNINYSGYASEYTTDRKNSFGFNSSGANIYRDNNVPIAHGSFTDKTVFTRNFKSSKIGNLAFSEMLKVYAGVKSVPSSTYETVTPIGLPNILDDRHCYTNGNYYAVTTWGALNSAYNYYVFTFESRGDIKVTFDYLTYLNFNSVTRGILYAKLMKYSESIFVPYEGIEIVNTGNNFGSPQHFKSITNWSGSQYGFFERENVGVGKYKLIFAVKDIVDDVDTGEAGKVFYAALKNLVIKTKDTGSTDSMYDDANVQVELINLTNNQVIYSYKKYGKDGQSGINDSKIDFYNLQSDTPYQVKYTFNKGISSSGGFNNSGGAFTVREGSFYENWVEYCTDKYGNMYKKSESIYTQDKYVSETITTIIGIDSFCAIAMIHYGLRQPKLANTKLRVTTKDFGGVIISDSYVNSQSSQYTKTITNTSTTDKEFEIVVTYLSDASPFPDKALLTNGNILFTTTITPPSSNISLSSFESYSLVPVFIGGCNSSYMKVIVKDSFTGYELLNEFVNSSENYSFNVSNILVPTYTKLVVEIIPFPTVVTSTRTGKVYETKFNINNLTVTETYTPVPSSFSGNLKFYIDDVLKMTDDEDNGRVVSYAVPKGTHTFKWVYTETGTGFVWDYAEIDYIKLTNWMCDSILVKPYCSKGGGDKCVEELLKCLIKLWKERPKTCTFGRRIWLFT